MIQVAVIIITWEIVRYIIKKIADKLFDHL